ncbi:hypothetical protein E0H26_06580 [Micromonospora zingiberis]|uniref:Uncharacterized protein n=1 Tax=Micromonospora zingiberis TaxID=2053011 RepID=A0A4V6N3C6_9ACTN|nr:hypothetical protein E0H26_06580 [Micromonospora zingiberis]
MARSGALTRPRPLARAATYGPTWAVAHLLGETFDTLALGYPPPAFWITRERARLLGTAGRMKVNGS